MKSLFLLLFLFSSTLSAEDNAIKAFKNNADVIDFLSNKSAENYWIKFQQMKLGGECGFTSCQWRKLVSLVVTSKSSNASSTTIIALVSGDSANKIAVNIQFVELKNIDSKSFNLR